MADQAIFQVEQTAIDAARVRAYFNDANDLNLGGAMVFSLLVYVVHDNTPWWTWVPALMGVYLVTAYRAYLFSQYRSAPEARVSEQWIVRQTLSGGAAGICWGVANSMMVAYLPIYHQLFVLTVAGTAAATSSSEGFALKYPPRAFILCSLTPLTIWVLTLGDRMHTVLGIMLVFLILITMAIINKKNAMFTEAQHLRFQNEFLVQQLSEKQRVVEMASKAKTNFLAVASHDLRQPLAALMLFLEQMKFEKLTVKGNRLLDRSLQATHSLHNLLENLLDISKLDGQAVKPVMDTFAVREVFEELENEFANLAASKGIKLRFSKCSACVKSDKALLAQSLRNLIANAIRYTVSGRILVGCRPRQGQLAIAVHDTGVGIAADQLDKIFDEFYQVGNKERDRERGLGLGLSIVRRITELLGISVRVDSQPGKGSTFTLLLPRAFGAEVVSPSKPNTQMHAVELQGLRVAVIENEHAIREGLSELLTAWGCSVVTAESAERMMEKLDRHHDSIDIIISDYGLGGPINGIEAIALMRQLWSSGIPAILITGDIRTEIFQAAKDAGLFILYKPIKSALLRDAFSQVLGGSK